MLKVDSLQKRFRADGRSNNDSEGRKPRLRGGYFHSLESVSFQCGEGEVLGLLGGNGAGKTTTMRVLAGALKADGGSVSIDGVDVLANPKVARRNIGFMSGTTGLYERLTGRENIRFLGRLYGIEKQEIERRIDELVDRLDMGAFIDDRTVTYSTGMLQKAALATSFVHQPKIMILDELTTGLDIMATKTLMDYIRELKEQGVAVIFSTHNLDEVSHMCDAIAVIHNGFSKFEGSLHEFWEVGGSSLHESFENCIKAEGELCG